MKYTLTEAEFQATEEAETKIYVIFATEQAKLSTELNKDKEILIEKFTKIIEEKNKQLEEKSAEIKALSITNYRLTNTLSTIKNILDRRFRFWDNFRVLKAIATLVKD
jgi:hypothetical protein